MPAGVLSPGHWALTIGYSGKENVLSRYEADLRRMAAESAAANVAVLGDRVRAAAFALKREFIPIALDVIARELRSSRSACCPRD